MKDPIIINSKGRTRKKHVSMFDTNGQINALSLKEALDVLGEYTEMLKDGSK